MSKHVVLRENQNVVIVEPIGRFVLGASADVLRQVLAQVAMERRMEVVISLHGVTCLDSAAIAELIGAYHAISAYGGDIRLANVSRHVNDIISVARLHMVFDVFDTEQEAVNSFSRPAEHPHNPHSEQFIG